MGAAALLVTAGPVLLRSWGDEGFAVVYSLKLGSTHLLSLPAALLLDWIATQGCGVTPQAAQAGYSMLTGAYDVGELDASVIDARVDATIRALERAGLVEIGSSFVDSEV